MQIARQLLRGVGNDQLEKVHRDVVGFHLRRALTDDEIAQLDPAWLALPALDPGTAEEEMNRKERG